VSETEVELLRSELEALTSRLRRLEDQIELGQLTARYGPAVDSGSDEAAAALWTDEGVFDAPPHGRWVGRGEIAGMVRGAGHQGLISNGVAHVLTAPRIVVSGDEAEGWNYALNIRWDSAAGRFWVARASANHWHFRRETDGWRIVERVNRNLDGSPEASGSLRDGARPTDDR
jgi:hypothetical protein